MLRPPASIPYLLSSASHFCPSGQDSHQSAPLIILHCCLLPSPSPSSSPGNPCLPSQEARVGVPGFLPSHPLPACLPVLKKTGDGSWVVPPRQPLAVWLWARNWSSLPLVRIQWVKESKGLIRSCTWQVLGRFQCSVF